MTILTDGLNYVIKIGGQPMRIRYYDDSTIGSVWDDERTITKSGADLYVSGIIQTVNTAKGSSDAFLVEEGRILYSDSKIFIGGSIQTTSGTRIFTIGPSGTADLVFREISPGINVPIYQGIDTMKAVYLRLLANGSLF